MILFPAIDIQGGKCVRLLQGQFDQATTYSDDPLKVAERWKTEGAQWLHIVDLDGARTGVPSSRNLGLVRAIASEVGLPIQFGGGVRSAESADRMFDMGVARVVVGTAAARSPELIESLFSAYGDKIAVGVDARDGLVAVHGWQESSGEQATAFVTRMAELGAQRFIYTDIARDGMLKGVNVVSLAQVAVAVPDVHVIASGGVTTLGDLDALEELRRISAPNLEGVIIGKAIYAGTVAFPDALQRFAT
jgi:phosphoribosylformimino-5-aminoimidazole carboxamide ribotide isomerase